MSDTVVKPKLIFIKANQLVEGPEFNRLDYGNLKELAGSIKENGLKIPLLVVKTKEKSESGAVMYLVIDGQRRKRSIDLLEEPEFEVAALDVTGLTETDILLTKVITEGKNKNLLEQGEIFKELKNKGMLDADIARHVSKSQTHVADCLLLTTATQKLKDQIIKGKISATEVVDLLKGSGKEKAEKVVTKAVADKGDKKVTNKDIKKAAGGEAVGAKEKAKAASAGKTTKAAPVKTTAAGTDKPKVDPLVRLKKLRDTIVGYDAPLKKGNVAVLEKIIDWLDDKIDSNALSPLFFNDENFEEGENQDD